MFRIFSENTHSAKIIVFTLAVHGKCCKTTERHTSVRRSEKSEAQSRPPLTSVRVEGDRRGERVKVKAERDLILDEDQERRSSAGRAGDHEVVASVMALSARSRSRSRHWVSRGCTQSSSGP